MSNESVVAAGRLHGMRWFGGFALLAGLVVGLFLISLDNEFRNANQHARVGVENLSRMLDEHVQAIVHKSDLLLREVQRNVRPDDMRRLHAANSPRWRELHALLATLRASVPEVAVIHVTDAKGNHRYSSLDPVPQINIADRYHFTRQRDATTDGLVISPPVVSRTTGKWTLILTRRLAFEDGSFAGIINIVLNLDYFQTFYGSLSLGPQGLVALYDKDLHLAARYPSSEKDMGRQLANPKLQALLDQGLTHGQYLGISTLDGIERQFAFRQVGGLPLIVFVGIAKDDYLADWRLHVWQAGIGVAVFVLIVATFGLRQRHAELELRASSLYGRSLIEASLDPLVTIGADGRIMDVNAATEQATGLPRERLIGSDFADYFTDPEQARRGYQEVFSQGQVTDFPLVLRHVAGQVTEVLYNASVYRDAQGRVAGVFAAARDVTERKRVEEELRAASLYGRSLIEASLDPLVTIGADGRIMDVNAATEKATGLPRERLIGSDFADYFTDPEQARRGYQQVFSQGQVTDFPLVLRHVAGQVTEVLYNASVYRDAQGRVAGVFAAARDVTERKRMEEELQRSNAELEQFAYAISHDMRQPLRMVGSYLQLIEKALRDRLDDDTRQFLAFAKEGAQRMDGMIRALLDFSRVGRKSDPLSRLDVRTTLDEALAFLGPELSASGGTVAVSGDWPALVVSRDEMVRLFQNLVGNALKYHEEGQAPEIEVKGQVRDDAWRCEVRDRGVGIDPTQIDRLFKVFSRLQSHARFEGAGVGLALCRKIVEHHGGRIGVESAGLGQGSLFWIELPLESKDQQAGGTAS